MIQILKDLLDSFKTNKGGFSSRKLTAFVIIMLVVATHIKWLTLGNLSQLEMVLTIDYAFISALFGMTTFQTIKGVGKVDKDTTKEEEDKKTE